MRGDSQSASSNNDAPEYELPRVQAYEACLSEPHRPPDFNLFEKFGDTIFAFGVYYFGPDLLRDEPDETVRDRLKSLITCRCHEWICRHVRMEGDTASMTQLLRDKGCFEDGRHEFASDYLECYLAMSYHQSPGTCMKTVKNLVKIGLQYAIQKNATVDPLSSSSSPSTTTSSTVAEPPYVPTTLPSPNPNPPPPRLSKAQRRKIATLRHQRAQVFIKFVYTELLFKKLMASHRPYACRTVFNAFLHYFSTHMCKTVYPNMIQATEDVTYTKPEKIRNENLDRLLNREPSWIAVAADIQSCPEVQESLLSAELVIVNVARLHDNGVLFKCGKGAEKWMLAFKTDPSSIVKEFAKPGHLYEWLQADEEVEELLAGRVLAPLPARENEGKSGENTQKQNPRQRRPKRKLTEESKDAGKDGDGKGTMNNRKKRQRRPKKSLNEK